ncbi:hypothetical protein PVAP13_9NG319028 [Panicum virgatum]|uniref:Uncharacterized protein n=1 Tax=Panicum virgatum TaxID=38727 RepID=A0A8T0MM79_PANVG|nr:hypothetical protein PVAP13_9NG319028 [Panicum virgatum]
MSTSLFELWFGAPSVPSPSLLLCGVFSPTVWRPPIGSFHHTIHQPLPPTVSAHEELPRLRLLRGFGSHGFGSRRPATTSALAWLRLPRLRFTKTSHGFGSCLASASASPGRTFVSHGFGFGFARQLHFASHGFGFTFNPRGFGFTGSSFGCGSSARQASPRLARLRRLQLWLAWLRGSTFARRLRLRPNGFARLQLWLRVAMASPGCSSASTGSNVGFDWLQRWLRVATASSGSSSSVPKATASRGKGFARL